MAVFRLALRRQTRYYAAALGTLARQTQCLQDN